MTASNVETRMRALRFMFRKLERIEVANLDFMPFFPLVGPVGHSVSRADTFLAMAHRAETVEADPSLWRTAQKSPSAFPFFSGPAQSPGISSTCSLERCWLSALTMDRSSRQRTRSSTAHQFCTPARLRGLNGEPCR